MTGQAPAQYAWPPFSSHLHSSLSVSSSGMGIRMFWIFLSLLLMIQGTNTDKAVVSRINYGILFKPQGQMYSSEEHWTHTFIMHLERPSSLNPFLQACNDCPLKGNSSMDERHVLMQLEKLHDRTLKGINVVLDNIFNLIPEHTVTVSRKKRSIIPIIGDIGKTLFGFATQKDLKQLANAMRRIQQTQNKEMIGFAHEVDILHSFMTTTDNRINNLIKGLKENNIVINQLNRKFIHEYKNLQEKTAIIMSILIDQLQKGAELTNTYSSIMTGVFNLLQKKLTTSIIPYNTLKTTIHNIQEVLMTKRPGFQLLFSDPHFYYRHDHFFFHRQGNKIMISIKFPIGIMHKPLNLFKIINYPVPLNKSSKHATSILDLPDYIAVTNDDNYYIEINEETLTQCKRYNHLYYCASNLALTHSTFTKCTIALFKDNRKDIRQTCDFRFLPNKLSSSLEQLNQTHFLLYNVSTLTLHSENVSKVVNGCMFCILSLPCNYDILTEQYYLPRRWDGCHHDSTTISTLHPVNLALLQEYFNESELKNITAETTFTSALNITTPPFQIYNHGISEILTNDKQAHMSLKKMIKMSKQNKLMFTSLADSMFNTASYVQESFPLELLLSILGTVLATAALILFLLIYRKYRFINAVIVANALIPKTNSLPTFPSFHYTPQVNEATTLPTTSITFEAISEMSNLVLVKVILLTFMLCFAIHIMKSKSKTNLILEITDGNKCIQLPIQQIPNNILSCHFKGSTILTNLSISFGIISKITIDWGDLQLRNVLLRNKVPLKSVVRTNPIKAYRLKTIVENQFSMFIWINHNGTSVPLKVCKPSCDECLPLHVVSAGAFCTENDNLLDPTM